MNETTDVLVAVLEAKYNFAYHQPNSLSRIRDVQCRDKPCGPARRTQQARPTRRWTRGLSQPPGGLLRCFRHRRPSRRRTLHPLYPPPSPMLHQSRPSRCRRPRCHKLFRWGNHHRSQPFDPPPTCILPMLMSYHHHGGGSEREAGLPSTSGRASTPAGKSLRRCGFGGGHVSVLAFSHGAFEHDGGTIEQFVDGWGLRRRVWRTDERAVRGFIAKSVFFVLSSDRFSIPALYQGIRHPADCQ